MREGKHQMPSCINLLTAATAPASTTTVYSPAFNPFQGWDRSLWVKFASAGTVDVKIFYVVAYWDEATNTYSDYVEPVGVSALVANSSVKTLQAIAFNPVVCDSVKIGFTGQGSNAADVTVSDLRMVFGIPE